jgi:HD-GYP domain-containing protein (c-di-GMP phosphodiesterase class II)
VIATVPRAVGGPWPGWVLALVAPLAVLVTLAASPGLDPVIFTPLAHFIVTSVVSVIGALLAASTGIAAQRSGDYRVLTLSLAFFTISGFWVLHGILTPTVLFARPTTGEGWSTVLAQFGGAVFLALSAVRPSPAVWRHLERFRRTSYLVVMLAIAGAFVAALLFPEFMGTSDAVERTFAPEGYAAAYGQPAESLLWVSAAVTIALLVFAARRYIQEYRLARQRLQASVTYGLILLIDAQVGLALSSAWHLAWWFYHWLVLIGLGTILAAIVGQLGQGMPLVKAVQSLFVLGTVERLEQSYNETLVALINSVEARDRYTQGHSQRVAQMAALIGEALRLPPEEVRTVHQAGLLHDVGKIGVPDAILNKPGRLTEAEFTIMKDHPARGEAMIRGIPSLHATLPGIRSHHERWDGFGYPDGLAGEAIPLQARILAVADVFDAMSSGRAYRPPHPREAVLDELRRGAGSRYDARVVSVFIDGRCYELPLRTEPALERRPVPAGPDPDDLLG